MSESGATEKSTLYFPCLRRHTALLFLLLVILPLSQAKGEEEAPHFANADTHLSRLP